MFTRSSTLCACAAALSSVALAGAVFAADAKTGGKSGAKKAPVADVIQEPTAQPAKSSPLDQKVKDIDGKEVDLSQYKGKVVMLVNVASKCGNTPQYKELQEVYTKYKDQGLVVIGFPANEFGKQEPGTDAEIKTFCSTKYNVSFPMFSKVVVKGEGQAPLYARLFELSARATKAKLSKAEIEREALAVIGTYLAN